MAERQDNRSLKERLHARIPPALETWWDATHSSLWFLPLIAAVVAFVLAITLVWVDHRLEGTLRDRRSDLPWIFGAGTDGARGVLSTIAGSTMTVIGTVFSITIVALQLGASQFTPRVLRQFTGDRVNQAVLAVFIGTFTYSILVLRTVRDETPSLAAFVPFVSVTAAITMSLVCIVMLIVFIHHMTRQMQVAFILERATEDALRNIDNWFREDITPMPQRAQHQFEDVVGHQVHSTSTGYLQHYDYDHLVNVARTHRLTVRILVPMGAYLNRQQPIAQIWVEPDEDTDVDLEGAADALRGAFVTGTERTLHADLPLGVRQIADIALKALSPGINDPTTATQAIDRLSEVLVHAGRLEQPARIHYIDNRPAVFLPRVGFDELTYIAFTQIRHYGKADLVVMLHLAHTIERIASLVQHKNRSVLYRHLELVRASGEQGIELGPDRKVFVNTVDEMLARVEVMEQGQRVPVTADIVEVG